MGEGQGLFENKLLADHSPMVMFVVREINKYVSKNNTIVLFTKLNINFFLIFMIMENSISSGSQELKKRLPRGAIKALALKYGFSLVWISKVVSGQVKGDPRIVEDAIQMASIEDEKRALLHDIVSSENFNAVAL